jgi:membrane-bound serine protease (ClpP class)
MNILLDPNVAYLLLVTGLTLAILALFAPGTIVLEVGAFIMLLLAGYTMIVLPINTWALVILVLGVFPFLLALRRYHKYQWLLLGLSMACLIIGTAFLFYSPEGLAIDLWLVIIVSVVSVGLAWFTIRKALEAMAREPAHADNLEGRYGVARSPVHSEGTIYIGSESWSARSDEPIPSGSRVRVLRKEGLILQVEQAPEEPEVDAQAKSSE